MMRRHGPGAATRQPGNGVSERTYEFVLNNRFLPVKNTSTYPPLPQKPDGEIHHDMEDARWTYNPPSLTAPPSLA